MNTQIRTVLDTKHAAAFLGLSSQVLEKWRRVGGGPTFIKLNQKRVGYVIADLELWLAARRFQSTSEYGRGIANKVFS